MTKKQRFDDSKPSLKEQLKHQSWCFKNGIKIYFEPIDWRRGRIVVDNNGVISESEEIYNQVKLRIRDKKYWEVIWELYTKFYNESNENNENK